MRGKAKQTHLTVEVAIVRTNSVTEPTVQKEEEKVVTPITKKEQNKHTYIVRVLIVQKKRNSKTNAPIQKDHR